MIHTRTHTAMYTVLTTLCITRCSCRMSDFAYSCKFFLSVVCLSVCLSSVTFAHSACHTCESNDTLYPILGRTTTLTTPTTTTTPLRGSIDHRLIPHFAKLLGSLLILAMCHAVAVGVSDSAFLTK